MSEKNKVYIECYDANGFYEENYERIMLVMNNLTESTLLKRDWVSSQAVGGTWARSIRCTFETNADSLEIKRLMLGLEYCELDDIPEDLHPSNRSQLFRFADIDVINVAKQSGLSGKLKLGEKKISSGDVREGDNDVNFLISCRKELLNNLGEDSIKRLKEIEQDLYTKLMKLVH